MLELLTLTGLTGAGGLILVFASSFMTVQNYYNPTQDRQRIRIHCYVGFSALILSIIHAFSVGSLNFSSDSTGYFTLGLIFIVDAMGIVMRFLPEAGEIRFHSRSYHPALVLGAVITAVWHILSKI